MKKILLVLCILFISSISLFSQQPNPLHCNNVTCPDGWLLQETGIIQIKINETTYCPGKICYCIDLNNTNGETPNFYIKKIIWTEAGCFANNYQYLNPDILKLDVIKKLIDIHMGVLNFGLCPHQKHTVDMWTSFCYATYFPDGNMFYPTSLACDGTGYCVQQYNYCYDPNFFPEWKLIVEAFGPPYSYDESGCTIPSVLGPNDIIINGCVSWCE